MDFKNTVIIMTSNLGSDEIQRLANAPHEQVKEAAMAQVKAHFRPEFINRIDEIVVFNNLNKTSIRKIASLQIASLGKRLAAQGVGLKLSDAALDFVAAAGFDPVYGARPLKRAVQDLLENPMARALLEGKYAPGDTVQVELKDGKLVFLDKKD